MIRKIFLLIISLCITRVGYSQSNDDCEFVKLSTKKAVDLRKDEPAFMWKGETFYLHHCNLMHINAKGKKRVLVDKNKIREMMKNDPELAQRCISGRQLQQVGGVLILPVTIVGIPMAFTGLRRQTNAVEKFFDEYIENAIADCNKQGKTTQKVGNNSKLMPAPTSEPAKATEQVVEQQPQAAVEEEEILENVEADETTPAVAEPAKAEAKPEPKPEKVKHEPAPKQVREPQPKLNERKRDGFGLFFNAGGFAFSGPEVGVEIRRNKFIPSFYIGFPHMGSGFKNKHDDLSSMKSVSVGAGAKGLIPMSFGGFYLGGILQYRRYAADKDASTLASQKVLESDFGILANAGIRQQTRSNLYFNLGGSVGPMFKSTQSRYNNILMNDYSPKYKKGDSETEFGGRVEISIGYEF